MFFAGIDIGSSSSKAVIMDGSDIKVSSLMLTGFQSTDAALKVMGMALEKAYLKMQDIACTVSTGYGRVNVPFAQKNITEISCHARGIHWFFSDVRTLLDMGGQDCKAISCDESGRIINFAINEKCAAGTGRYIERLSRYVKLPIDDLGPRSLQIVTAAVPVDSFCVVFAENDVLLHLREGSHVNDIVAGALDAVVERIIVLIQKIGAVSGFAISGGIAKNIGVVTRLEKRLGIKANIPPEPQIVGAVGAALYARDLADKSVR